MVVGFLSISCSAVDTAGSDQPSESRLAIDLPDKNRSLWVMPLDAYFVSEVDLKKEAYLHALYSQECLSDQGFHHEVPALEFAASESTVVRNWFDETVASEFGYHSPISSSPSDEAWVEYTQRPISDDELAVLDQCVHDVVDNPDVPKWTPKLLNYAGTFGSAAITGASEDPQVAAAAERWRTCMKPIGIEDLPSSPNGMPTDSMRQRYGWADTAADSAPPLTPDEIADAVEDAKCQESSGYSESIYDAEWERQVSLLEENYESFVSVGEDIKEVRQEISERMALMAPER